MDALIITWYSPSILILFMLKSLLSDITMAIPVYSFPLDWNVFLHPSIFSFCFQVLHIFVPEMCFLQTTVDGSCFGSRWIICLLTDEFKSLAFRWMLSYSDWSYHFSIRFPIAWLTFFLRFYWVVLHLCLWL